MSEIEFSNLMKVNLEKIEINLTDEQINRFYLYMKILIEWNKKINLTAIICEEEIVLKHFIDSLTSLKHIKGKVVDVGTGAGFPGIPLKIADENLEITLVDSLAKRITFLEEVIEKLQFKNIKAIHTRVEDLGRENEHREKYDIAISRAVAPLKVLIEYISPLVKVRGNCICMKGPKRRRRTKGK